MCNLVADRIRLAAAGGGPGMVHRLTGFEQFHTMDVYLWDGIGDAGINPARQIRAII
jgi:hypothetical protein